MGNWLSKLKTSYGRGTEEMQMEVDDNSNFPRTAAEQGEGSTTGGDYDERVEATRQANFANNTCSPPPADDDDDDDDDMDFDIDCRILRSIVSMEVSN